MPDARYLVDLSHTSHTQARTGIQRVTRGLYSALGAHAVAITFDPYRNEWRELRVWEQKNLEATAPGTSRGARWPLQAKLGGLVSRGTNRGAGERPLLEANGTLVPEIFSASVAGMLSRLPRPRVALFHDAIALKLPEFTPRKTVGRFPAYLRELLSFDGIAAVSDDSRASLLDYWEWLGAREMPDVRTIPLGIDVPGELDAATSHAITTTAPRASQIPVVLTVGSIEGRKNHLALLEACEQLWARGRVFELHVVGIPRPETAGSAIERIAQLQAKGRALRHDQNADDAALAKAYAGCAFTVYPSRMEGFGLPVFESLARGKPCICSNRGALGEAARNGGCLALPSVGADALATAIDRLLAEPSEIARLQAEARARKMRTWSECASELTDWIRELRGTSER